MKNSILFTSILLMAFAFIFNACSKDQVKIDREKIEEYLAANNIEAEMTDSGLFYKIEEEGTGANPTSSSKVEVKYKGALLDGTVFDQTTTGDDATRTFPLTGLIRAWQEGIPLIKKGGKITLYSPSELAYGKSSRPSIPGNSVLIFEIELVDFEG